MAIGMSLTLGQTWVDIIAAMFFGFLALLLMGVILLQRGRGVGLAGAFGGAGGNTAFGAKTGDVLTWVTVILASVFLLTAVLFNYQFRPSGTTLRNINQLTQPAAVPISTDTGITPAEIPAIPETIPATETPVDATPADAGTAEDLPVIEPEPADVPPADTPAAGDPNGRGAAPVPTEPNRP